MQRAVRTRPFPARKRFLFESTSTLLAESPLVLFLRPTDFSTSEWTALRSAMSSVQQRDVHAKKPRLTFLRAGMLPAIQRHDSAKIAVPDAALRDPGSLAALTAETDPATLKQLLRILDKASATAGKNTPPPDPKKPETQKIVRLPVVGGTVDGTPLDAESLRKVADMPALDVLRAQIVGLISAPASSIVSSVGAGARAISRTLQGYRPADSADPSTPPSTSTPPS